MKKRTCKLCKQRVVDDPRPSLERALLDTDIRRKLPMPDADATAAESYESDDMRARTDYARRLGAIAYEVRAALHALSGVCWFCAREGASSTPPAAEKQC